MRSPALRFGLLIALVVAGLAIAYQSGLVEWLRDHSIAELMVELRGRWWTPLALAGLCLVIGCLPLPVTPVVLVAGAVYGPLRGWMLNLTGCLLGAAAGYVLARSLGREMIERLLGEKRWRRLEKLIADHGLYAMIRARWMLPLVAVNFAGGLSGMRTGPFLLSSVVGLAPTLAVYTYVGHLLITTAGANPTHTIRNAALIVLAMLAVSLLPAAIRRLRRR